jgi:hypothetical protein
MPDEPVALQIYCSHCGGEVTLQFQERNTSDGALKQHWICPWCRESQSGSFPALLTWVVKSHVPDDEPPN